MKGIILVVVLIFLSVASLLSLLAFKSVLTVIKTEQQLIKSQLALQAAEQGLHEAERTITNGNCLMENQIDNYFEIKAWDHSCHEKLTENAGYFYRIKFLQEADCLKLKGQSESGVAFYEITTLGVSEPVYRVLQEVYVVSDPIKKHCKQPIVELMSARQTQREILNE